MAYVEVLVNPYDIDITLKNIKITESDGSYVSYDRTIYIFYRPNSDDEYDGSDSRGYLFNTLHIPGRSDPSGETKITYEDFYVGYLNMDSEHMEYATYFRVFAVMYTYESTYHFEDTKRFWTPGNITTINGTMNRHNGYNNQVTANIGDTVTFTMSKLPLEVFDHTGNWKIIRLYGSSFPESMYPPTDASTAYRYGQVLKTIPQSMTDTTYSITVQSAGFVEESIWLVYVGSVLNNASNIEIYGWNVPPICLGRLTVYNRDQTIDPYVNVFSDTNHPAILSPRFLSTEGITEVTHQFYYSGDTNYWESTETGYSATGGWTIFRSDSATDADENWALIKQDWRPTRGSADPWPVIISANYQKKPRGTQYYIWVFYQDLVDNYRSNIFCIGSVIYGASPVTAYIYCGPYGSSTGTMQWRRATPYIFTGNRWVMAKPDIYTNQWHL